MMIKYSKIISVRLHASSRPGPLLRQIPRYTVAIPRYFMRYFYHGTMYRGKNYRHKIPRYFLLWYAAVLYHGILVRYFIPLYRSEKYRRKTLRYFLVLL